MDEHIVTWMLEFLARQQISPSILNAMLTDPRFSVSETNNPRFKRTICLNTIQNTLSDGDIASELILESLEIVEELDRLDGILISDSMKLAYRAVAIECTVKYLRIPYSPREEDRGQFFEVVMRIWRERIGQLERLRSELVTDELRGLKEEIEAALYDSEACKRLVERFEQAEAVRLVRVYLNEALAEIGPSVIELAAELTLKNQRENGDEVEIEEEEIGEIQQNDVSEACFPGSPCNITDSTKLNVDLVPTPIYVEVRKGLNCSFKAFKVMVNDPLPEALRVSDALRAELREKISNMETSFENRNGNDIGASPNNAEVSGAGMESSNPVASVENENGNDMDAPIPIVKAKVSEAGTGILNPVPSQVIPNMDTDVELPTSRLQIFPPKRSLMERNSTACTIEWNDSIDSMSQEATNSMDKEKLVSCEVNAARRKPRKWSLEEEEELKKGVKKYGTGNWKLIWNSKREIFIDRTTVDLKDKWRNMSRFGDPLKDLE